jgi:hypothetical protein
MPTREEAYLAAVKASERLRDEGYRAADQLHSDATEGAHQTMMASRRGAADADRLHRGRADASDARKYLYEDAERRHFDRRAALARHFGQYWTGPGNPDAEHAKAFVVSLDPSGEHEVDPPAAPLGSLTVIEHHAGIRQVRRVHNGRVVPEVFGSDPPRATFTGDLAAAKARAVMTPSEIAEMEAHRDRLRDPLASEAAARLSP